MTDKIEFELTLKVNGDVLLNYEIDYDQYETAVGAKEKALQMIKALESEKLRHKLKGLSTHLQDLTD